MKRNKSNLIEFYYTIISGGIASRLNYKDTFANSLGSAEKRNSQSLQVHCTNDSSRSSKSADAEQTDKYDES